MEERMGKGLKPHVVKVTTKGRIYGACDGKNAQDDLMKSQAPRYLDVFIIHVKHQIPTHMATLQAQMDGLFIYKHNPLCRERFEDYVCQFLKGERSKFKHLFTHKTQ